MPIYERSIEIRVPLAGPIGEHTHRISFMATKMKRWIDLILTTQQANPLVTKLEEQTSSRNSRAVVKDPSLALFSKEQNNRFFCKHQRRRPLKEALHHTPLRDFNRHLLGSSRKIWGNARLGLHRVSKKPNNNYFSVNYVKETPLLPLFVINIGYSRQVEQRSVLSDNDSTVDQIWLLRMFCLILIRRRGRNVGRCADWYVIITDYECFSDTIT